MIKFNTKVMLARRNMTQKQLAELTGIRPPTISKLSLGTLRHVPVDLLDKVCKVLNCQPGDILEYVQSEPDDIR